MPGRGLISVLVAAALLASGCTQEGPKATPAPDFAVKNVLPEGASTPAAAEPRSGLIPGGLARASATPAAPQSGATAAPVATPAPGVSGAGATAAKSLGTAIVNCANGTPWEYTSGSVATPAGYKVTYTIEGKAFFKGAEYCKVSSKVEITQAGIPSNLVPTFDYYFRVDPTGAAYADIWYVYTVAGQTQESHLLAEAGG